MNPIHKVFLRMQTGSATLKNDWQTLRLAQAVNVTGSQQIKIKTPSSFLMLPLAFVVTV